MTAESNTFKFAFNNVAILHYSCDQVPMQSICITTVLYRSYCTVLYLYYTKIKQMTTSLMDKYHIRQTWLWS